MQTLYHSSFLFGISRWGHIFFARCVNIVVKQFFAQGFDQLAIAICPRFFCLQDAVIASCRANADASGSMTQTRPFGSFVDRLFLRGREILIMQIEETKLPRICNYINSQIELCIISLDPKCDKCYSCNNAQSEFS